MLSMLSSFSTYEEGANIKMQYEITVNTIRTGGAGAYCRAVAREYVAHEIRNYLAAKKLLEDHQAN